MGKFLKKNKVKSSCPTLWDPMDCSLPGSSVHWIIQARKLEWLPCPPPGDLPNPGIEPGSPTLQADSLPSELPGKPRVILKHLALCPTWRKCSWNVSMCPGCFKSSELLGKPSWVTWVHVKRKTKLNPLIPFHCSTQLILPYTPLLNVLFLSFPPFRISWS